MSIYGCALFERKHEKVLKGMKALDNSDIFTEWDISFDDIKFEIKLYNIARKPSRKVCRLRDIFYGFAYNRYHFYTDEPYTPDRKQSYHFGKMELFV